MWTKLKQFLWQWRGVMLVAPSMAGLVVGARFAGLLQVPELRAFDQFVRLRPQEEPDDRIVIVGISEADLQTYGFPIADGIFARALEKIAAGQPRAIGLDIYRDLPVPPAYENLIEIFRNDPSLIDRDPPIEPGYQKLVETFRNTPNLIGIVKVTSDETGEGRVAASPVLQELGQLGSNDLPRDTDAKVRRGFLYLTDQQSQELVFSLAFRLAMLYLEAQNIEPELTDNEWVKLGDAVFPPFESNDGGYVRTDAAGYQVLMNYRGPQKSFTIVELNDILDGKIDPERFRDRIVLIGSTAPSLNDYFDTPYSSTLIAAPEQMSGVEVHANLTSQILSATLDGRTPIKVLPEFWEWLLILAAATGGAILSWQWRYTQGFTKILPLAIAMVGWGGIAYLVFLNGWWIPVIPPILAVVLSSVTITVYVALTAANIRQAFSRYLTDEVVANLLETPEGLEMGGELRTITILTSDLRGFTSLSERLSAQEGPQKVVSILNIYLEAMAETITSYQGTIDEFMGDGILVLFGAPTQREDDPERAVACAVAMQLAMKGVNQQIAELGLPDLEMGIGINTGEVVVGNIGSQKRTKYGVVGSQVNLTYRIESYTIGGQILISQSTLDRVRDITHTNGEQQVSPKGVKEPITIYSVSGIDGNYNLALSQEKETFVVLRETVPLEYRILEGKHISETAFEGRLIELSDRSAKVRFDRSVRLLLNLKLRLRSRDGQEKSGSEFYAKVVKKSGEQDTDFLIRLTSVPPDVKDIFDRLYQESDSSTSSNIVSPRS
ncbi:adenylate/guanylate cyclase domain-containing protein [Oscillatoriales cyanobacterium LEGE 11467]|uniref:Adenylate/guanylate cyclase domain-containing protein n=1 Tax=Zarconia navalis LEGE 11467 TaxID=1828826 RepID=A0A928VS58_9CYAN|nr:adenylate/guanylate cyclase domain-containing protein [Zarconia navalis]MBE9039282.1 adenylate/guanylate cyclase domain-containing protein [Zarconia navalis LEGE 11467]